MTNKESHVHTIIKSSRAGVIRDTNGGHCITTPPPKYIEVAPLVKKKKRKTVTKKKRLIMTGKKSERE